jgi:hypothetical protein
VYQDILSQEWSTFYENEKTTKNGVKNDIFTFYALLDNDDDYIKDSLRTFEWGFSPNSFGYSFFEQVSHNIGNGQFEENSHLKNGSIVRMQSVLFPNQAETALIRALENAKAFSQQLQENREKRLWKKVDIPCNLYNAINRLTKAEMDTIRKNYDFRNLSSLKKAELASELAKLIPLKFKKVIYTLDQSRYNFIKIIIKNSGVIPDMGISVSNAEAFIYMHQRYCFTLHCIGLLDF